MLTVFLIGLPYFVDFFSGLSTFTLAYTIFQHEDKLAEEELERVILLSLSLLFKNPP